jgi:hypothetical protein
MKRKIVTKGAIQTWSAAYMRGIDSRVIGEKGSDHGRKGKIRGGVRVMENRD